MKTKHFFIAALVIMLSFTFQVSFSAPGTGSVMGQVIDPDTKQPVSDASVIFECAGSQKVFPTNEHGYYYASNIPVCNYKVTASFMSKHSQTYEIAVGSDEQHELNISMSTSVQMTEQVIYIEKHPLVDPLQPEVDYIPRDEIKKLPITTVNDLAQFIPSVTEVNGVYYVKGAREGSLVYYIDGIPVLGNPDIPLCGLDTYTAYTGFVPVKYGNTTGGVVVMETRSYFSEAH